jgi:rod shape determining protein RodA
VKGGVRVKSFSMSVGDRFRHIDPILFTCTAVLSFISILTIWSAVDNFGRSKLIMQIAMTVAGSVAMFIIANVDYRFFVDRFAIFMFLASVLLLALTLFFGSTGQNITTENRSWIVIPIVNIKVQPSEFVKIAFLCTFSKHLEVVRGKINKPKVLLGVLAHAGVIVGLIFLSGDLGVALIYLGIVVIMLFCAELSGWYFLGSACAAGIIFPFLWDFLKPYQQNRIIYGFQPELDPEHWGMQALMSRDAIAGGGLFGKGFASGGVYEALPASHTDFIFSTVCEKFGFFTGMVVVIALAVLSLRLIWLAYRSRDFVGRLICSGIAAIMILQTVENLWMCLGLVPVIGITLPFMSAGGSSLFALYFLIGLGHSVYAHEKRFFFKSERRTK